MPFEKLTETIVQIETVLDHLTGEEIGQALEAFERDPAILDAIYLMGIGKKNRPCGLLRVLCRKESADDALASVFRHTHTLGARRTETERVILRREESRASVAGEEVRAKSYELEGRVYERPEADEIARVAAESGIGAPAIRLAKKG